MLVLDKQQPAPQSPLRVLQLTLRVPWPLRDGGAQAMYQLTSGLHQAGAEVTLLAINTPKHAQAVSVLASVCRPHSVEVDTRLRPLAALRALLFSATPYNILRFASQAFGERLAELLQANTYDCILLEGVYLAQYLPILRAHSQAPVVLRAHNVEYEIWERFAASERNPLKRAYTRHLARAGKRFEQAALQAVDAVLPITERDAAHIRQLGYTGPLCVLPMGMSLADFPATPPAGQPHRVAFLGSLEWLPNIQGLEWLLEKVWPAVLAAEPAAELHIAGRNPAPGVRQWQYPNVHIHGEIPDAQAYLAEASLVVVPLLAGSGMRVKLLEAFAMARPVVATPLAAEGIAVQSGTHCLLADSPTEFAAGIIHLLRNPEARQNLGQASRQLVQTTYNSQAIVARLLSFLQSEILPQNQA